MANIIVTLLKDEETLLVDFVLHHLEIGFDKIIIFDDLSRTPASQVLDIIPENLLQRVTCIRIPCDFHNWGKSPPQDLFDQALFDEFGHTKQMYFCNLGMQRFCKPSDWIAFTDVDEFIWLPRHKNIDSLRDEIQRHGYVAMILTMLLYGHSFNLVAPPDNNVSAFIWRSSKFFSHGKFLAHAGSIKKVLSPHLPALYRDGLLCDMNFSPRSAEHDWSLTKSEDTSGPHLKHFTILDVASCFTRRMRIPVSQNRPFTPDEGSWTSRVDMLRWTSSIMDPEFSVSIMLTRQSAGLDISPHARALSRALDRVSDARTMSSTLDFDRIRQALKCSDKDTDAAVLFRLFSQPDVDVSLLRFVSLPLDFDSEVYRSLHGDLRNLSRHELEQHYLNYGRFEKRAYQMH